MLGTNTTLGSLALIGESRDSVTVTVGAGGSGVGDTDETNEEGTEAKADINALIAEGDTSVGSAVLAGTEDASGVSCGVAGTLLADGAAGL